MVVKLSEKKITRKTKKDKKTKIQEGLFIEYTMYTTEKYHLGVIQTPMPLHPEREKQGTTEA